MTGHLVKRGNLNTKTSKHRGKMMGRDAGRTPWKDEDRNWSSTVTSQRTSGTRKDSSPTGFRRILAILDTLI